MFPGESCESAEGWIDGSVRVHCELFSVGYTDIRQDVSETLTSYRVRAGRAERGVVPRGVGVVNCLVRVFLGRLEVGVSPSG